MMLLSPRKGGVYRVGTHQKTCRLPDVEKRSTAFGVYGHFRRRRILCRNVRICKIDSSSEWDGVMIKKTKKESPDSGTSKGSTI